MKNLICPNCFKEYLTLEVVNEKEKTYKCESCSFSVPSNELRTTYKNVQIMFDSRSSLLDRLLDYLKTV